MHRHRHRTLTDDNLGLPGPLGTCIPPSGCPLLACDTDREAAGGDLRQSEGGWGGEPVASSGQLQHHGVHELGEGRGLVTAAVEAAGPGPDPTPINPSLMKRQSYGGSQLCPGGPGLRA